MRAYGYFDAVDAGFEPKEYIFLREACTATDPTP